MKINPKNLELHNYYLDDSWHAVLVVKFDYLLHGFLMEDLRLEVDSKILEQCAGEYLKKYQHPEYVDLEQGSGYTIKSVNYHDLCEDFFREDYQVVRMLCEFYTEKNIIELYNKFKPKSKQHEPRPISARTANL